MSEIEELFTEFEEKTDSLISLAQELLNQAGSQGTKEKVEALQMEQKHLVDSIVSLEKKLSRKGVDEEKRKEYSNWARIEEKLTYFQNLNEEFINHYKVRKGLIQFEMEKVKKTKKALNGVKKTYVNKGKKEKGKKEGKRINTLS